MSELPEFLTTKQLAEWLGVSQQSLATDRYLGQGIPYIKIGKRVRYTKADVLDFLNVNRVETGNHA